MLLLLTSELLDFVTQFLFLFAFEQRLGSGIQAHLHNAPLSECFFMLPQKSMQFSVNIHLHAAVNECVMGRVHLS